ncbi:MAG: alanine racemase [Anaerolineales bacterium]|nr:alanine racemase [Anaerolineales bacterium]
MRPTYLEVDLNQLKRNVEAIRAHVAPAKIMPMLKANAYGHGMEGVSKFIEPYIDYFGVALVEEGIYLRSLGIKAPILVAGGIMIEQLPLFLEHDLTLSASSPDLLAAADQLAESTRQRMKVHLKFDTGMERVGVHEYEAEPFLQQSLSCSHLEIEGIYCHLANSELVESGGEIPSFNSIKPVLPSLQLERFQEILRFYEKRSLATPMRHICNSGGILNLPDGHMDMVRPGVLFYGVYPGRDLERTLDVKPIATWKSRVSYSKIVPPGRPVSYGSLWQAEGSPTRIVTIPCGYADGYFRRMTNQARVIINGKSYPQVGRICMDQFMVDVGDDEINVGDEAILLGDDISVEELADWAGTSEYEILTNFSARVPRVYVGAVQ